MLAWIARGILGVYLLMPLHSAAALTSIDSVHGPGTITRDSAQGLDWLDLTLTVGISYEAITHGIGNTWFAQGWRYAESDEIRFLLANNLGSFQTSVSSEGDPQPGDFYAYWQPNTSGQADTLIALLGNTYALLSPAISPGATGIYGREIIRSGLPIGAHNLAAIISGDGRGMGMEYLVTMQGGADDTRGFDYIGHFLVMSTPIPEPAGWILMVCGVALVICATRVPPIRQHPAIETRGNELST